MGFDHIKIGCLQLTCAGSKNRKMLTCYRWKGNVITTPFYSSSDCVWVEIEDSTGPSKKYMVIV